MKTNVLITGATGNMGWAGFQEILKKRDRFHITLLARPSKINHKKLALYEWDPDVTIVWGDLGCYEDVLTAVKGADYVLHIGGMVSPAADYYPEKTLKVNVEASENIAKAVLAQPNADQIKVVYIGSVAQYGDHPAPNHWGSASDEMGISHFDAYALSKCIAEHVIVNSGIKHWVSLRQSGILYGGILGVVNPTAFHVPINGVLEWATIEDSGRLLSAVIEPTVPEDFWNKFYNIGSGEQYRLTNYEFEQWLLSTLGLPRVEKVFEPQWFALKNFHGMWYTDADELERYLHFRENLPIADYFRRLKSKLPWFYSLAFLAPAWAVKMFMKPYAYEEKYGTQWWVKNDPKRLKAYFGSLEAYKAIQGWSINVYEKNLSKAQSAGQVINQGLQLEKSVYAYTKTEINSLISVRGLELLDEPNGSKSNIYSWKSSSGKTFKSTLEYILLGGGKCIEDLKEEYYADLN